MKLTPKQTTHESLAPKQRDELLQTLRTRFEKNMSRHKGLKWADVQSRLEEKPEQLWSLNEMEATGGEPDVVSFDKKTEAYVFFDCSPQSPKGRTSLCYDRAALDARKKFKPKNSVIDLAAEMGVSLLTEEQYFFLQTLGEFDTKSSSWLLTPPEIRKLGGAIYGDRRYGRVFTNHNGADSYYGGRGFRSSLAV